MPKKSIEIIKETFKEDDATRERTSFYEFGGWRQSRRKQEYVKLAKDLIEERGLTGYQGDREDMGVPLGQRFIEPYYISGTDVLCDGEDLHQVNNAAIQQMGDDIKRTAISGLDMTHRMLEVRIGATVTPETINRYLEVANHTIVGGAVAQEHMAEINPAMTRDGSVKIMSGNEELMSHIDKQYIIDINREYPANQAEALKEGIGKSIYQVVRVPTVAVRNADGGTTHRWAANQCTLGFITAYALGGGSILADFSLTSKHMQYVTLGTPTWPRRGPRGKNEPGGIPYGYVGDFCQADAAGSDEITYFCESMALSNFLYLNLWVNGYVIGGIGGVHAGAVLFTNNVLDELAGHITDWIVDRYGGLAKAKPSFDVIRDVCHEACFHLLEEYNRYPLLLEHHWGGAIRMFILSTLGGMAPSFATGHSLAGMIGYHYTGGYLMKEAWGRGSFGSQDSVDHMNLAYAASMVPDEGLLPELRGPNFSSDSTNAIVQCTSPSYAVAAHAARKDAWCLSPVVKVAFADSKLPFNFKEVRKEIARGTQHEFMPEGDRDPIKPGR
ncbi:MAG: methyl-coenzyme M reductase subunit alpha [Candidatus Syntrophoarchaeum sp.]|nr:methyl-coenzyme M reductase subunit alpha [Candidatus Syntrophoarchaeum sp.]